MTRKKRPEERKNGIKCHPGIMECLNCSYQTWACSGGTNQKITKVETDLMNYAHAGAYYGPDHSERHDRREDERGRL